jgi:ABC-type molybdate transport system substrate-binding protein
VRKTGRFWEIPPESYPKMQQSGVILKSTKHLAIAQDFRSFMLSDPARAILKNYGFSLQ